MGCCQSESIGKEFEFSQVNTVEEEDYSGQFKEVPLSSENSPLKFLIFQETAQKSLARLSYETTGTLNLPQTRTSLELAFVCSRL